MRRALIAAVFLLMGYTDPAEAQLNGEWMADNLATGCEAISYLASGDERANRCAVTRSRTSTYDS